MIIEDIFDEAILDAVEEIEKREDNAITIEAREVQKPIDYSQVQKLPEPKRMPDVNDLVYSNLRKKGLKNVQVVMGSPFKGVYGGFKGFVDNFFRNF